MRNITAGYSNAWDIWWWEHVTSSPLTPIDHVDSGVSSITRTRLLVLGIVLLSLLCISNGVINFFLKGVINHHWMVLFHVYCNLYAIWSNNFLTIAFLTNISFFFLTVSDWKQRILYEVLFYRLLLHFVLEIKNFLLLKTHKKACPTLKPLQIVIFINTIILISLTIKFHIHVEHCRCVEAERCMRHIHFVSY